MKYGITYQGSKNAIAKDIIELLPSGRRFVDLFGGGGAISHCAALSSKWQKVLYNEYNPLLVDLIKKAINGDYRNETRWISRDDFLKLKEQDGYVKYCWSFGCAGNDYMYSKEVEPWKRALHHARVLGYTSLFAEFGIKTDGSREDVKKNQEEYKRKYIYWYLKNVLNSQADFEKLRENLTGKISDKKEELRLYLCEALKKSGLKQSDIDKRLNTQMSGHWFGRSQWQFPTRELYNKMREFLPLKDYDEVYGYAELLQSLESLQSLEIKQGSYLDYVYEDGDVVYCDPPYEGTMNYDKKDFNHAEFYDWVASRPYQIFFSSYEISDNRFYKVWSVSKRKLMCGGNSDKITEFVYSNKPYKTSLFDFTD